MTPEQRNSINSYLQGAGYGTPSVLAMPTTSPTPQAQPTTTTASTATTSPTVATGNNLSLTPQQQAAVDSFLATTGGRTINTPVGPITIPSTIPGITTTPTPTPNNPYLVGDLGGSSSTGAGPNTGGASPQPVVGGTPSSGGQATNLTSGEVATMFQLPQEGLQANRNFLSSFNPFARPVILSETQGIGSLAPFNGG